MPMPPEIGLVIGDHDEVEGADWDRQLAPGAEVILPSGVGLDGANCYPENIAHNTRATATATVTTTRTRSRTVLSCSRNGLKPMVEP